MPRLRVSTTVALVAALLWSALLLVLAVVAPVYTTETGSSSDDGTISTTRSTATLAEVDGVGGVLVMAIPLLAALVVGGLILRGQPGSTATRAAVWVTIGLLTVFTVLGAASVGRFVLPATGALAIAATTAYRRPTAPIHPPPPGSPT